MSRTAQEEAIEDALPSGWQHTFFDPQKLRRLNNADMSLLGDKVNEYDSKDLREEDIIDYVVERVLTSFTAIEDTLEFPALGLATMEGVNLVRKFAARYKADNSTPSGTIKDPARAGADDIVFSFATPEVYDEISGTTQDTFEQPGLTAPGTLELIGNAGVDETSNTAGSTLSLDADEYLFVSGDYVDLSDGRGAVTGVEVTDVDGESYGPVDNVLHSRLSGTHMLNGQGTYATATLDVDAKIYASADAEIVPLNFYMAPGTKAPSLT